MRSHYNLQLFCIDGKIAGDEDKGNKFMGWRTGSFT